VVAWAVFYGSLGHEEIKGLVEQDLLLDAAKLVAILAQILGQFCGR